MEPQCFAAKQKYTAVKCYNLIYVENSMFLKFEINF